MEIKHNNKTLYLNKTTTMWLLQEGERVSSDRLFRVRSKQPFSTDASTQKKSVATTTPTVCSALEVGEICVLIIDSKWRMGRVLQFAYYQEKTKKTQQYRGSSVIISESKKDMGVLCTWFELTSLPQQFAG